MKDSRSTVFVKANSGDDIAGVERLDFDDLILLPQMGNVDGLVSDNAAARLAVCNHVYGLVAENFNLGILVESGFGARIAKHLFRIRLCNWRLAMIAGFGSKEVDRVGFCVIEQPSDDVAVAIPHRGFIICQKRHAPHLGHHILGGGCVAGVGAAVIPAFDISVSLG